MAISLGDLLFYLSVNAARAIAKIKREFTKFLGITATKHIALLDDEYRPQVSFTKIAEISPIEIFQSRNGRSTELEVHAFPARFLLRVEDSSIIVDANTGLIFARNRIISESSAWPKLWLTLNSIPQPVYSKRLNESEGVTYILLPSNGFYHSLLEDVPLFLNIIARFSDVTVLIPENSNSWIQELARMYSSRVVTVPRYYKPQKHYFVSRGGDSGWPHPADVKILRASLKPAIGIPPKNHVYVSRLKSSRSPVFEAKLCAALESMGWIIAYMEDLALIDQIKVFSSAKVLAGVHGAGLAGIVWMEPGTSVVELGPNRYVPCYTRLATIVGLNYLRVEFEDNMSELEVILKSIISFSELPD